MLSLHGTSLLQIPSSSISVFVCLCEIGRFYEWTLVFKVTPDFDLKSSSETLKPVKQVYLPSLMCCILQTVISGDICAEQHLTGPTDLI